MVKRRNRAFKSQIAEARRSPRYWTAMSAFQFSEGLRRLMREEEMTQRDLAHLLDRSEAWVSKLLNGTENLTLQKMNEVAMLLGAAVHVHVARQSSFVEWEEVSAEDLHQRVDRSAHSMTKTMAAPLDVAGVLLEPAARLYTEDAKWPN